MTNNDPEVIFHGCAKTLATHYPEVITGLFAEHVAGSDGRCRGCGRGSRPAPLSPCGLHALAELANDLATPVRPARTPLR